MELIPDENLPRFAVCEPAAFEAEPGKMYSWCSCGLSEKESFCDNAHRKKDGLPYSSIKVIFDKAVIVWFCQCKRTKTPPFCDDTHKTLDPSL